MNWSWMSIIKSLVSGRISQPLAMVYYYYYYRSFLYPKQSMFLGYAVLQILLIKFIVYLMLFPMLNSMFFQISTFRITCSVPSVIIFCSSLTLCFQVCCSDTLWMIFRSLQLTTVFIVSHLFIYIILICAFPPVTSLLR